MNALACHAPRRSPSPSPLRGGFSLVELLVASTLALMMMGLVATLFSTFSGALTDSQATVESAAKLRAASWQLRKDLAGITVPMQPPVRPEADAGYFELIEGPRYDRVAANGTADISADTDDILMFTTKSTGSPFVGRYAEDRNGNGLLDVGEDLNGNGALDDDTIESDTAEVAWFCRPAGNQPVPGVVLYNLYRRQRLVVGYVGKEPFLGANDPAKGNKVEYPPPPPELSFLLPDRFLELAYDISLRPSQLPDDRSLLDDQPPVVVMAPNTLADLTKRENRFGHQFRLNANPPRYTTYPHPVNLAADGRLTPYLTFDPDLTFDTRTHRRAGQDIILTNVIAFDVRVYDPDAPAVAVAGAVSLSPGDPGYTYNASAAPPNPVRGAYINLGDADDGRVTPLTVFARPMDPRAGLAVATYDTWSTHYEFNGMDENGNGVPDEGTNGLDDNGNGLVDEDAEAETSPPYPVSLRAIEVRIRCYEPTSRQIRQVTIRHAFPD